MSNTNLISLVEKDGIDEVVIKMLMGDVTSSVDLLKIIKTNCKSIPDKLFYKNVEMVMKGLDDKKTIARKVGERLAKSEYGYDVGIVLLKYIYSLELPQKGRAMAYLLDAVSKDFIEPNECMRLCRYINIISFRSLLFVRENVSKKRIHETLEDHAYITELEKNGLLYNCSGSGLAFDLDAYLLDKYSLSYDDENKYGGFADKFKGIPSLDSFPTKPVYLSTGDVPYMSGKDNNTTNVKDQIDVDGEVLTIFK